MRSKTSFFNLTLFWKTVCRFWPVWALYTLVWLMALPLNLSGSLSSAIVGEWEYGIIMALRESPLDVGLNIGMPLSAVFCCFSAMAVYGHLYFPRSAGAYASLPLRREGVFASVTLAGIAPLLLADVAVFAVSIAVEAAAGVIYMPALWSWLGMTVLGNLFFFGFAAFCAQLTGSILVLPFVYALLNFAVYAVDYVVGNILKYFVYGYVAPGSSTLLVYFSPLVGIFSRCGIEDGTRYDEAGEILADTANFSFNGWGVLGVYAALGLALLVCAVLLYRRRRMETAGDVVAVPALRPVFKYCMAGGCGLCLGLLLYYIIFDNRTTDPLSGPVFLLVLMLLGCFIGYFSAEMLLKKSFAVFRGGKLWLGFAVTCALFIFFIVSCETDLWGYERRVPDPSQVESVVVGTGGDGSVQLEEPENLEAVTALHREIIAHKALHESGEFGEGYVRLTYSLKDGSRISREYDLTRLPVDGVEDLAELQRIINTDEAISVRKATAFPITAQNINYASIEYTCQDESAPDGLGYENLELTAEEANELYYECILPDIKDRALGRVWLIRDQDYLNTVYACTISIDYSERGRDQLPSYQYFYTVPTTDSLRTNAWLEAHGIDLCTLAETGVMTDQQLRESDAASIFAEETHMVTAP